MEIITQPNLPSRKVTVAISAVPIPGIRTVTPKAVTCLPSSMQCHADLQICHLDGNVLLCAPEVFDYYKEALSPMGFEILCGESPIGSTYPKDAAYNVARVGNAVFLNPKSADPAAVRFFQARNIEIIPVRQGYTKCAVLPVDEHSLITADRGVARAARTAGFSVLEIAAGDITLPGFPYGFFGGAGGKLSADTVYLTGSLIRHPSAEEIFAFLQKRGIKIREGSIPIPIDVGSVLPLMTE